MSDNKPKIDLKARLGKKTVSGPAAQSVPPPMGMPRPSAPAPAQAAHIPAPQMQRPAVRPGGSVPVPPFAQPSRPRVDPTDPYAAISAQSAPAAAARPREIRVDMEEVQAANRGRRGRVVVLALITAAVGGVIGFAFGGGVERGKSADAAVIGAKELLKDVEASNAQIEQLAETIKSARTKVMGKGEFPQDEVTKLGAINIPFKSTSLLDKGIGRFKRDTMVMLIDYATAVEAANDQKEGLQRLLGSTTLKEFLDEQKNPKVRWNAYVVGGPFGPWVALERNPNPFLVQSKDKVKDKDGKEKNYTWPEELEIKDGKETVKVKRYASGDPTGNEPPFIPVNPQSANAVCTSDVVGSLVSQMVKMEKILRGDSDPTADQAGLVDRGKKLAEQLKRIGAES